MSLLRKYTNLACLTTSYFVSKYMGRNTVWGMPFSIGIELCNYCNLRCRHCASGAGLSSREKGYISMHLFDKIIKDLSPYTLFTMFYFQGESMMHPQFFEMLEKARDMGVIISTNGHYLDPESCRQLALSRLRKIIVSLDGLTPESYTRYRIGGNLETVLDGIVRLSTELNREGRGRRLELQVLVNRYNEGELDRIWEYARNLGVRIRFKSMQIESGEDSDNFLPENPRYRRYSLEGDKLKLRSSLADYCYRLWTNPVISWDGNVLPCCFDKDARYIMGNMQNHSFKEIWKSQTYNLFRSNLLQNRAGIDICNNCSEGLNKEIRV